MLVEPRIYQVRFAVTVRTVRNRTLLLSKPTYIVVGAKPFHTSWFHNGDDCEEHGMYASSAARSERSVTDTLCPPDPSLGWLAKNATNPENEGLTKKCRAGFFRGFKTRQPRQLDRPHLMPARLCNEVAGWTRIRAVWPKSRAT
jgi:hypothetical protein